MRRTLYPHPLRSGTRHLFDTWAKIGVTDLTLYSPWTEGYLTSISPVCFLFVAGQVFTIFFFFTCRKKTERLEFTIIIHVYFLHFLCTERHVLPLWPGYNQINNNKIKTIRQSHVRAQNVCPLSKVGSDFQSQNHSHLINLWEDLITRLPFSYQKNCMSLHKLF
jgi:hypothetical protein